MAKKDEGLPKCLAVYNSLGLDISYSPGDTNVTCDCPFCGREGKFSIHTETGMARCFVCNVGEEKQGKAFSGINAVSFLRNFYKLCLENTEDRRYNLLAQDRRLYKGDTLKTWGLAVNILTDEWLLPAYDLNNKVSQLYRYTTVKTKEGLKKRLFATEGLNHQLIGRQLIDGHKKEIYICEGVWDAMALYEVLKYCRNMNDRLVICTNFSKSLINDINVLAVPGCGVWNPDWGECLADKNVRLVYDSDHPRRNKVTGKIEPPVGTQAMRRVTKALADQSKPPAEIFYMCWGEEGYDPKMPDGYDLRDFLTADATKMSDRITWWDKAVKELLKPIPSDWLPGRSKDAVASGKTEIDPLPCEKFEVLGEAVAKYLTWTGDLKRTFACMLSSILSTNLPGDQLWLRVIGPPSCGKSELCELIQYARKYVVPKSNIRGFHSGYKNDATGEQDVSLLEECRDKTLVTKDGDTLMQSPNKGIIMSEARDAYDRVTQTHYRNGIKRDYEGHNMTWILCGTPVLHDLDSSELGERFVTSEIRVPGRKLQVQIQLDKMHQYFESLAKLSKSHDEEQQTGVTPERTEAIRLSIGYINFLRESGSVLLSELTVPDEQTTWKIGLLARFTSLLRSKPNVRYADRAVTELPYRLTMQFSRLSVMLAVVLNKKSVDEEILKMVTEIAIGTAEGSGLRIAKALHGCKPGVGLDSQAIVRVTGITYTEVNKLIKHMRAIDVVTTVGQNKKEKVTPTSNQKYVLTDYMSEAMDAVFPKG